MGIKKVLLGLVMVFVLFLGVNTAAALSSSVLDAISGLPLSDQILFIAKEVDRLKLKDGLRDACDLADELYMWPEAEQLPHPHILNAPMPDQIAFYEEDLSFFRRGLDGRGYPLETPKEELIETYSEALTFAKDRYNKYLTAKAECDRLTEEYNRKYGE